MVGLAGDWCRKAPQGGTVRRLGPDVKKMARCAPHGLLAATGGTTLRRSSPAASLACPPRPFLSHPAPAFS